MKPTTQREVPLTYERLRLLNAYGYMAKELIDILGEIEVQGRRLNLLADYMGDYPDCELLFAAYSIRAAARAVIQRHEYFQRQLGLKPSGAPLTVP